MPALRSFVGALCVLAFLPRGGQASEKGRVHESKQPSHEHLAAAADRIVERYMHEKHVPGMVLAVLREGNLVVEKGYGVRSRDDKQTPDSDTLYYIGSLSKAITAVGIEVLAEHGKLDINEPAERHVRDLPKAWRKTPLKYFLAHQSGIPQFDVTRLPTFDDVLSHEFQHMPSEFDVMLREFDDRPLTFRPGSKQEFNNFNFALAGKAIEGASGHEYLTFMHEAVFQPLGMTRSGFGRIDVNMAPGHHGKDGEWREVYDVEPDGGPYGIPSGFLQTTLHDLVQLYHGILDHKLFHAARSHEMLSAVTPGLSGTPGWFVREVNGVTIVGKDGAAAGYSCQFQFTKGGGDAVIFLMNLQAQSLNTHALADELLREVCGLRIPPAHAARE